MGSVQPQQRPQWLPPSFPPAPWQKGLGLESRPGIPGAGGVAGEGRRQAWGWSRTRPKAWLGCGCEVLPRSKPRSPAKQCPSAPPPLAAPAPPWAAAPKAKAKLALTRLCPVMWALPTQNPSSQGVWEGAGVYGGRVSSSTRGPSERARLSNLISTARCGTLVLCARTAPAAAPLPAPHFRHCHPSLRFSSFCCKTG